MTWPDLASDHDWLCVCVCGLASEACYNGSGLLQWYSVPGRDPEEEDLEDWRRKILFLFLSFIIFSSV